MHRSYRTGRRAPLAAAALMAGLLAAAPAEAVEYLNVTVQPDRAVPGACFSFSVALPLGQTRALEPFVAIEPAVDHSLQGRGKDLCVTGLRHGTHYAVRLKAGLPAADGTTLAHDVSVDVDVPDREASVSFDGGKTLLPYTKGVGLPLKSVNVGKAHITLYRFAERALADQVGNDWFGQALSGWNLTTIAERSSKLFEGTLEIASKPNQQMSTAIPIDQLIKTLAPGVYVAVAVPDGKTPDDETERATQWFSVSDIGLVTVKTDAGMLVSARSLQTAQPQADVDLQLVATSNEVLATYKTDADGRVTIPAGMLRGEAGDAPRLLAASMPRGDYTWLQLDAPALDLTDLDVKGRAPPGPLDAFLWTDRGIYRPGETIHLGTLLRDAKAHIAPATAITLHLVRPDGIEVDHLKPDLAAAGGGTLDIHVPDNAYTGEWTIWAGAGGKEHLGSTTVSVQDFVPPRLEAKLDAPAGLLDAAGALTPTVQADYFYGSPGSGLTGQVEGTIKAAPHPFDGLADYSFGLVQEPFLDKDLAAQEFTTDDKGSATVTLQPDSPTDTTHPVAVTFRATVNDVDGRPAVAELTRPLHTADRFIGLRVATGESVAENADASFDIVLVGPDGKPAGPETLKWDLVKEDYNYTYFYRDSRWQSEEIVNDTPLNGGEVGVAADGRAHLTAHITSGRFRLEAYDQAGKTASSLRFGAGWWDGTQADSRKPDVLPVTIDPTAPAGTVRARVEPTFAGRVLVMLDGNGLHQVQERDFAKGGGTVDFDAADVPASGAYVLAVAVSPAGTVLPRLPVRAVGLAWVPGAAAAHTLTVALEAPDKVQPKTKLSVGVTVTGGPRDEPAYVTLAAVDDAVLLMTDFAAPDPAEHFVGRREPGLELRDVYGSLIDPSGQAGRLVEGGDARAKLQMSGLDVKTFKTVALFQGPVRLDSDGHGRVEFDVPDFSGRVRLMAVAWTVDRFGKAEQPIMVRPPLLAELTLPRFLAPGDKARARVMLTDLEAPEQTYQVAFTTAGAVALDRDDALFKDVKRDKRRFVDRILTATGAIGAGHIHMTVTGDDGSKTERDFEIGVRSPNPYVTERQIRTLDPGQKLTAGDALGEDLLPGTGKLDVAVSTVPAFDVPGLLAELRRYPYGCAEQTVSRAFPELFATALGAGVAPTSAESLTPQGAIAQLYSLQSQNGSFGYWSVFDDGNLWLTAYVVDFLQHAEKQNLSVPESMQSRALAWLGGRFATVSTNPVDTAGAAYAAIVLARANKLDLSQLRYVASRTTGHLPSDAARVQLAAALTHAGEQTLASDLMRAGPIVRDPLVYLNDYGSDLRDRAMALALAGEEKLLPEQALIKQAADLAHRTAGKGWLSTQEETWLLRSAFDLKTGAALTIDLDGKPVTGRSEATSTIPLGQGKTSELRNNGQNPVYVSLATTGVPSAAQPAEANGFSIQRSILHLDGSAADLAAIHQNDELVVVLEGSMTTDVQRKVLVVDMLPAGLEPGNVGLSGDRDATQFAWLKDLTEPTFTAVRDDRYLAGMDLSDATKAFKLAYVVRAVTPGTYAAPGPEVEDMYAPAYHARGAAGTLEVKPAGKP